MRRLDPALLLDATQRAQRYIDALPERSVPPDAPAVARLAQWVGRPLPDGPLPPEQVLAELDEFAGPATMASAGPRFFGFVVGGALPASLAASWLANAWDQNAFMHASSPAAALIEQTVLGWSLDLFDLPRECAGAFTTGATLANLTGLAAARHALLERAGWSAEERGLFGAPEIPVFASEESHPTVRKALGVLGLGRARVTSVATDDQGRIRADALPRLTAPSIVCSQAGNVNGGASDPFDALADWCSASGSWLHVDGAFGLWAAATPSLRDQVSGIERADSWATDAHKWLNVPYDSGIAFVKDANALRETMSFDAAYLPVDGPREPFHYSIEASRRARGIEIWAALRSLGRSGVEALIDGCCRHARRFAAGFEAAGFSVLNDVVLNQVVVSFGDEAENTRVIAEVQREGVCWCGPTRWRGQPAMRISVSSWATEEEDVDRSLASILRCARG